MKLTVVNRTIEGRQVTITPFPPIYAVRLAVRLAGLGVPGFAKLLSGVGRPATVHAAKEQTAKVLPEMLIAFAEKLEPEAFSQLVLDLLVSTSVDGVALTTQAQVDVCFMGDLPALFQVVWAVLEANGFFGLGAIGSLLGVKAPTAEPTTRSTPVPSTPS